MSLTENGNGGMIMPVTPFSGGNGNGNDGFGGESGWWIILLFLFALGGWGNNGGYGGGNGNEIQRGFDQAQLVNATSGIMSDICNGFSNVQQSLCNGFAGVNATLNNGFANAETAENARQMANMQQMFDLSTQFANCCCENRLASAQLQNVIQTENCADRTAIADALRDVLEANNASTQKILDVMCQDKIDQKNERIADLERQLTLANLAASQGAQTAAIIANNEAQTVALERYLSPTPQPAYIVQNPNCCSQNMGCGCGSY